MKPNSFPPERKNEMVDSFNVCARPQGSLYFAVRVHRGITELRAEYHREFELFDEATEPHIIRRRGENLYALCHPFDIRNGDQIGTIHLLEKHLDLNTIAHEATHAAIAWASWVYKKDGHILLSKEELIADTVGHLTEEIHRRLGGTND